MFADKLTGIREALTFDDVLLVPMRSPVDPVEIDVSSSVSRHIKVKREESIKIRNVHTVEPETPISDARAIMRTKNIAGLPVISNDKLVGIVLLCC